MRGNLIGFLMSCAASLTAAPTNAALPLQPVKLPAYAQVPHAIHYARAAE